MAKKNQTKARRNNTVVGHQVVNSHNSGSVHTDARVNRSKAVKREFNNCTFNYGCNPHTCKIVDFADEEIKDTLNFENENIQGNPQLIEAKTTVEVEETKDKKSPNKMSGWKKFWLGTGIVAGICTLGYSIAAYNCYYK